MLGNQLHQDSARMLVKPNLPYLSAAILVICMDSAGSTGPGLLSFDELLAKHGQTVLSRGRRQLIYPNSTLLQFNIGIGVPTPAKNVNMNYAFQANFQLPWNRSQIPVDLFWANSGYDGDSRQVKRDAVLERERQHSGYMHDDNIVHFYQHVEGVLNSFGHNGTLCVLQTLCRLGAEPLHTDDEEDLLHELALFLLTPSEDDTECDNDDLKPYTKAHTLGRINGNCMESYGSCSLPLIDMFSRVYVNELKQI